MSEVWNKIVASNAWSNPHQVPICPSTHNPWIYGAYALKVLRKVGIPAGEEMTLLQNFRAYADKCRIVSGLFNRTPAGDIWTSHDELMGIAYIDSRLAAEIVQYLSEHDGFYTNLPQDAEAAKTDIKKAVQFNVYRFPWLLPYLKAAAGYYVNPVSQSLFALHLLNDIRVTKPNLTTDAGGRLRIWLMLEPMERFVISGLACSLWRWRMKKLGYSPKNQLAIEPQECPILSELAPDSF